MKKTELLRRTSMRSSIVLLLLALSACTLTTPLEPPPLEVIITREPAPEPEPEPREPAPPAPVVAEPEPIEVADEPQAISEHIAIVLSSSMPAYVDVAAHLVDYLEHYDVYDMTDRNRTPQQAFSAIADSNAEIVVAIGLYAANVAKSFAAVPVIFSQVFNDQEHDLVSDDFKGVSALPPMALQVDAWRKLDPDLQAVGAILGEGHEDLIAETELAMQEHGIKFEYAIARSDRETMYHFNRLIHDIDGFLLFPDNRILSRTALSEIMSDAARHHVQLAVFNDKLLEHGATFSANAIEADIADKILFALQEHHSGKFEGVPDVAPLSQVRIQTNPEMAQKFGLNDITVVPGEAVAEAQ